MLLGCFSSTALLLAAVGVYGLLSFSTARRRREIGIRAALGARRIDVVALIVRRALVLSGLGIAIGLPAALALSRVMESLLFGITASDPATYGVVTLVLVATALAASFIPAWRAAKVEPVTVLHEE